MYENGTPCQGEVAMPKEQPEFEMMYQKLSTSISDIDFLTSEILQSINKFVPVNFDEKVIEVKEPCGIIETFNARIAGMKRITNRLDEINSTLRKIV